MKLSDLCGIQPVTNEHRDGETPKLFHCFSTGNSVSIIKIDCPLEKVLLTEKEALEEVLSEIKKQCEHSSKKDAPRTIASATRRGDGKVVDDLAFYKGISEFDCGIIALHDDQTNLYSVIYMPKWQDYYLNVEE